MTQTKLEVGQEVWVRGKLLYVYGDGVLQVKFERADPMNNQIAFIESKDVLTGSAGASSEPPSVIHVALHFDADQKGWPRVAGVYSTYEAAEKRVEELGSGATQSLRLNEPVRFTSERGGSAGAASAERESDRGAPNLKRPTCSLHNRLMDNIASGGDDSAEVWQCKECAPRQAQIERQIDALMEKLRPVAGSAGLRERLEGHSFIWNDNYKARCRCGWRDDAPMGYTNAWEAWVEHVAALARETAPAGSRELKERIQIIIEMLQRILPKALTEELGISAEDTYEGSGYKSILGVLLPQIEVVLREELATNERK
jgi:hypothetical protein